MEVQTCCQVYLKYVQSSSIKISLGIPLIKATLQLHKMIPHQLQISGKILFVWYTFDGTNLAKAPLLLLVQNTLCMQIKKVMSSIKWKRGCSWVNWGKGGAQENISLQGDLTQTLLMAYIRIRPFLLLHADWSPQIRQHRCLTRALLSTVLEHT